MADDLKQQAAAEKKQRDLRQEITDRMVQSLERGQIPWERPWESLEHGLPRNMATGKPYKGSNRLLLQLAQMDRAYADPRFGTIKQINELGGRVKQGEKGHPIEVWKDQPFWVRRDVEISLNNMRVKVFDEGKGVVHVGMPTDKASTLAVKASDLTVRHNGRELDWSAAHSQLDSVVCRVYTVFNVEQCAGLKIEPLKTPDNKVVKIPVVERAEQLMAAMREDGLRFATHPEHAFYSPKRDEVSLPPRESFKSVEGYYGTALHEIGHATGAAHRLNREGITGGHRFGSEGYAKEELRAELFSAYIAAETGIPHDEEQHKAYIQSWIKVLKQDKNEIFRAAAEASKAVDYVLAKEQSLQIDRDQQEKWHEKQADQLQPGDVIVERSLSRRNPVSVSRVDEVRFRRDGKVHVDLSEGLQTRIYNASDKVVVSGMRKERVQDSAQSEIAAQQSEAPTVSVFCRKVNNAEDLCESLTALRESAEATKVRVVDGVKLSQPDYDRFTADFFAPQPWLAGKGGIDEGDARCVIQVTAQDRQTLHIDPSGYDYARYVGIPAGDVQRVMDSRSLVVAKAEPAQQKDISARVDEDRHLDAGDGRRSDWTERSVRSPQRQSTRRSADLGR